MQLVLTQSIVYSISSNLNNITTLRFRNICYKYCSYTCFHPEIQSIRVGLQLTYNTLDRNQIFLGGENKLQYNN